MDPALEDHIFGDLMSDNTSVYTFNKKEFESGRVAVLSHLTPYKHSGINIDKIASRLGVGRATALRTLEATNQHVVRQSNFSLGGRHLIYRHDRLHYKRLHDWFYSDTTYVRPKFQLCHGDSRVQNFSTKYQFTWDEPMAGDTNDNVGNALL